MAKANSKAPAAKRTSRKAAKTVETPFDLMCEHIREITAIHAQMDCFALALANDGTGGASGFRDGELTAIAFNLEERLMHVRDALVKFPIAAVVSHA